jgi:hypothetical protein
MGKLKESCDKLVLEKSASEKASKAFSVGEAIVMVASFAASSFSEANSS